MNERPMDAQELIKNLKLAPHPEGGHYREIFRSGETVNWRKESYSASTSILFLLARNEKSRWHRIPQAEVWHFYSGDPLELVYFDEAALTLNKAMLDKNHPVAVVPGNYWQAARPVGGFSLLGCTVSPGFEFRCFELLNKLPEKADTFKKKIQGFSDFQ